jgi:hypothetical protein
VLYAGRGLERQALVDELLVAVQEGRFHFAPGLEEQEAMSKALLSYRRVIREDGLIGSELVVALLLALSPPPPVIVPMSAFRRKSRAYRVTDWPVPRGAGPLFMSRHRAGGSVRPPHRHHRPPSPIELADVARGDLVGPGPSVLSAGAGEQLIGVAV